MLVQQQTEMLSCQQVHGALRNILVRSKKDRYLALHVTIRYHKMNTLKKYYIILTWLN